MSLYRYFKVNKNLPDPSGPLSKTVPSSSIEAANAKVSVPLTEPQNPEKWLEEAHACMVVLPLQWASKRSGSISTNHRFNTVLGHSAAILSLVGVVELGLNLEIYSTKN